MRLLSLLLMVLVANAQAAPVVEPVRWSLGDTEFEGVLIYDGASSALRPGLLVAPNWMGVNASAISKATEIAGSDFVVLLADVYGLGLRPQDAGEAGAAAGALYQDRPLLAARANATLEALKAQAGRAPLDHDRLAAIGFCFGGTVVLDLARSGADVAAVVSFHGNPTAHDPALAANIRAKVLVLNGADDPLVSREQIHAFEDEMRAAGVDWQFVNFGGAVHCFAEADAASPPACLYHEPSQRRGFALMQALFDEAFASRTPAR